MKSVLVCLYPPPHVVMRNILFTSFIHSEGKKRVNHLIKQSIFNMGKKMITE